MLAATKVKMSGSEKGEQDHIQRFLHKTCNSEVSGSFWKFHVVVVQNNGKEMHKKVCCRCKVVFFLLVRTTVFLAVFDAVAA